MVETVEVKCWLCGGRGWLVDHVFGICTFGIGYIVQKVRGRTERNPTCPICHGRGSLTYDVGHRGNKEGEE